MLWMDSTVIRVLLEGQPEFTSLRTVEGRKEQGGKLSFFLTLTHKIDATTTKAPER